MIKNKYEMKKKKCKKSLIGKILDIANKKY